MFVQVTMLLIAAVLALLGFASGCSCMRGHSQQDFCRADFAIKGVMKNVTIDDGDRFPHKVYTVLVEKIFKGEKILKSPEGSDVLIQTPFSTALCGVDLNQESTYLLLGGAKENGLFIHSCIGNNLFKEVTDAHLNGLHGGYDCSCNIIMAGLYEGGDDRCYGPDVFGLDNDYECHTDYEVCAKVDDECKWICSHDHPQNVSAFI